jgi:hypothetical protein
MINILVSDNYNNEKLNNLLLKNDVLINETILNYGILLYENQYDILQNINNESNIEITTIKTKYEEIINKIESEKIDQKNKYLSEMNQNEIILKEQYETKIKFLENDIDTLKNNKIFEITSFIEKGKQIAIDDYEKILNLHKKINDDMKTNYETQIKLLNEKNNRLDENIEKLNNKLVEYNKLKEDNNYNSINSNINNLDDKMSDFLKLFCNNTKKGEFGETFIENYLANAFLNSNIIDKHKETACGDFLFIYDYSKILLESKNVQILKKDDTDKFYRDIELRAKNNEINSALLISLHNTSLVNGSRHFVFEIKNNIPIIMISDAYNNPNYIKFSILLLNNLLKCGFLNNMSDTDEDKLYYIINSLNEMFSLFKNELLFLENDKQILLKLDNSFKKREANLFNMKKLFTNIFSKYPDITAFKNINENKIEISNNEDLNNDPNFNIIIDKIKDKLKEDPSFNLTIDNLKKINISGTAIRKYSMKKIIEKIKTISII